MIIPVRCFTCGKVLGDKWSAYINIVNSEKSTDNAGVLNSNIDLEYLDTKNSEQTKSLEGQVLDKLNITRYCCRRMMLTNVNIISDI